MPAAVMPATLKHVQEALYVGVRISVRIFQRIAHPGLRREMNEGGESVLREQSSHRFAIGKIGFYEGEAWLLRQDIDARPLQRGIVIVVDAVEPDNRGARRQQALCDM